MPAKKTPKNVTAEATILFTEALLTSIKKIAGATISAVGFTRRLSDKAAILISHRRDSRAITDSNAKKEKRLSVCPQIEELNIIAGFRKNIADTKRDLQNGIFSILTPKRSSAKKEKTSNKMGKNFINSKTEKVA